MDMEENVRLQNLKNECIKKWRLALNQFAISFGERIPGYESFTQKL